MPFGLPDLAWWGWALAALGGGILAQFIAKFSDRSRFAAFLAVVIAVLASMCGLVALFEWIRE